MLQNETTDAQTIEAFCRSHCISRAFFYVLKKQGKAPREIRIGAKVLISRESAADWRRAMESASPEAA